jgi:hypothetical protein
MKLSPRRKIFFSPQKTFFLRAIIYKGVAIYRMHLYNVVGLLVDVYWVNGSPVDVYTWMFLSFLKK